MTILAIEFWWGR